jgi:hypothetical protein
MLKQGVAQTVVGILSDDSTEKQQCASNLLTSFAMHCELIAL